jgi:hypothetical protein
VQATRYYSLQQTIYNMENILKSEAEAKYASELKDQGKYVEPNFDSIFSWLTYPTILRFFLAVFIVMSCFLVGIALQAISLQVSVTSVSISFVLPKFDTYTAFAWMLQFIWWGICLLFGIFLHMFALHEIDETNSLPKKTGVKTP